MFVPKFPPPTVGGLENQSYLLSKELLNYSIDVDVLSTLFSNEQLSFELLNGIKIHRMKFFNSNVLILIYQILFIPKFLFVRRKKYDLIHIHQHSLIGLYVLFFSKLFGYKVVVKLPNLGKNGLIGLYKSYLGGFKIKLLKKADAIIAMTPIHKNELLDLFFPEKIIASIPNGVLVYDNFVPNISNEKIKFCYVGRLEEQKGILFLLECWAEIAQDYPNIILEIWGDGSLKTDIFDLIKYKGLCGSVSLMGHTDKVIEVLKASDVFIITSFTEGMSNSILEAMSFGKSIIASNVGGACLQFKDNFHNSTYELNDKFKLIQLIIRNIEDVDFRLENGKINFNRSKVFHIRNVARQYKELYLKVCVGSKLDNFNYDY